MLHVFSEAADWRLGVLTPAECAALAANFCTRPGRTAILDADADARATAAAVAERTGLPVDANLWIQVEPSRVDEVGRPLAEHPASHGAVATTGVTNLQVAMWVRDLDELSRLVTEDLGALGVASVETVLVGPAVQRPESPWAGK